MRRLRRNDEEPRVEMLPLFDVVFLLLILMFYSLVVITPVRVLPVQLTAISGQGRVEPAPVQAISIDAQGKLFLNREPISLETLGQRFETFAAASPQPQVFVAVEAQSQVDRAPLLMQLINLAQQAGLETFGIVGPETQP